jgi:adenosine deaminase CECR1
LDPPCSFSGRDAKFVPAFAPGDDFHSPRRGGFFGRFEELKKSATPAQLYALLYDLPKRGDLHNHLSGSDRAEWIFDVCVDPARNGGDTLYPRAYIAATPDAIAPGARYQTIRKRTYDRLSAVVRAEYVKLADLTPTGHPPRRSRGCATYDL